MNKPRSNNIKYLDFTECMLWLEHIYKTNPRDFANKINSNKIDNSKSYKDFWRSVIERKGRPITNKSFFRLDLYAWSQEETNELW